MKLMKKTSKFFIMLVVALAFMLTNQVPKIHAASFSLTPRVSTVSVGQSVTITFSASGHIGRVDISGAVSDSFWMEGNVSKSYTITASSEGTISLYANASNVSDEAGSEPYNLSVSATINVVAPTPTPPSNEGNNDSNNSSNNNQPTVTPPTTPEEKKSSDASLSELTLSEGTLSPAFSADTTEYSVSLGKDATAITIGAKANHASASVSGAGEQTLKPGLNELKVVCTAEDGSTRTYLIKANVDETPSVFVDFSNNKLGVVKDISSVSLPDGFEEIKVTLGDSEVPAWKNPLNNLIVVYLSNEANEKNFYLYDEASKTITSIYKPMGLLGRNIAVIDIPKELQEKVGMEFGEVEVSGVKMMGWKFIDSQFANYTLIYVMDEQGKMVYYLHEKGEDTLQLYSGQAAMTQEQAETHATALTQRMYLIIALLITNVLTVALLLIKFFKKPKRRIVKKEYDVEKESTFMKDEDLPLGHSAFKYFNEENESVHDSDDDQGSKDEIDVEDVNRDFD